MRALALQEQSDPAVARIDDQFFVGDNLLVAPIFNDVGDRKLYLPSGKWYDFFGETPPTRGGRTIERRSVPLDRLPVYVRAGAIIPLGPVMQHTSERSVDPLSIHVYGFAEDDLAAKTLSSETSLYEDDGVSNDYKAGKYQRTGMNFQQSQGEMTFNVRPLPAEDGFVTPARAFDLHFHGIPKSNGCAHGRQGHSACIRGQSETELDGQRGNRRNPGFSPASRGQVVCYPLKMSRAALQQVSR